MAAPAKALPLVKDTEALSLQAVGHDSATLSQIIKAALTVARKNQCCVRSTWNDLTIDVTPEDTYQGVQRRVNELRKPAAKA